VLLHHCFEVQTGAVEVDALAEDNGVGRVKHLLILIRTDLKERERERALIFRI
jgi:hypothetical protein